MNVRRLAVFVCGVLDTYYIVCPYEQVGIVIVEMDRSADRDAAGLHSDQSEISARRSSLNVSGLRADST